MICGEELSIDTSDATVIRVRYVQIDGKFDMGGSLVFDRANRTYIAEQLEACCSLDYAGTETQLGPDHLRIYQSGADYCPTINILCRRDGQAVHAGLSGLMLTAAYALRLSAMLRELAGTPA